MIPIIITIITTIIIKSQFIKVLNLQLGSIICYNCTISIWHCGSKEYFKLFFFYTVFTTSKLFPINVIHPKEFHIGKNKYLKIFLY